MPFCVCWYDSSNPFMIENVTIRFRKEYVKAVLRHDVDFIESISPGRLGQRFSEESSRIVTGLGPDLGTMVRFVTSMITGCIIGFIYVRYSDRNYCRAGNSPFSSFSPFPLSCTLDGDLRRAWKTTPTSSCRNIRKPTQ